MHILTDFHHSSLLRSITLLFERRLGYAVYRPIGMDWFYNGYWAVNSSEDTAKQFLLEDHSNLVDGTPPLNRTSYYDNGIYRVNDPGGASTHRGITLDTFKKLKFDFLIASIPQHVPIFERLIAEYQPNAKLIVQIGNEWPLEAFVGKNVLASIKERSVPDGVNALFYHQEFDLEIFKAAWPKKTNIISSYVNVLQNMQVGWKDFLALEEALKGHGMEMFSYGGQCRDGNKNGPIELAQSMLNDEFVFHVKDGGDGFGHVIYNAYACGRPVITRKSFYKDKLAEELMNEKNTIDLDQLSISDAVEFIMKVRSDEEAMTRMSQEALRAFYTNVNYKEEADSIRDWVLSIKERS